MAKVNDRIVQIGKSIRRQSDLEQSNPGQKVAIARFDVEMIGPSGDPITHLWLASQPYQRRSTPQYDIVGNFKGTTGSYIRDKKEAGSQYFDKNSAVGVLLTQSKFGTHTYRAPKMYSKKTVERTLKFSSKATFNPGHPVTNLVIEVEGDNNVRFANINDLLRRIDQIESQLERKRIEQEEARIKEEQLKAEQEARQQAILKAQAEEAERIRKEQEEIEAELRRQEELRLQEETEIEQLKAEQARTLELIEETNTSFRKGQEIRVTHIVDESQTQAKVSHLYDGVPIVIDGGPGTGKTTTSIQRLKFLIDPYLHEHETCQLAEQQISLLTDPGKVSSHWIFFSPSNLLAQYLKSALSAENLANDIKNVTPFENFLIKKLQEYHLTVSNTKSDPPFRPLKSSSPLTLRPLIKEGALAVNAFEDFLVEKLSRPFRTAVAVKTAGFDWRECAMSIQLYCKDIEKAESLLDVIKLMARIQDNEKNSVKQYSERLTRILETSANRLRKKIMADEDTVQKLAKLFDDWATSSLSAEAEEIEFVEEEESIIEIETIDNTLYKKLQTLLKRLSFRQFDKSVKLSKQYNDLYELVKSHVDGLDLSEIGNLAWFDRNFASLCQGDVSIVLKQLANVYKSFRRLQIKSDNSAYDTELLSKIMSEGGDRLHHDEQALMLGFINNVMRGIVKWSPIKFNSLKHPYAQAYQRSIKYVIGVDEASDYSELDYYCISSFAHYEFSAITLCGDLMQGLGKNGLKSWDILKKWVFPKLDVFTLKKSYRQWPTLLEVSRRMYQDDRKEEAPYESAMIKLKHEAEPLAFISTDEDAKIEWLAQRIDEVRGRFNELPAIAIFINDDEDVDAFMARVRENNKLDKYIVDDCTHGYQGREDSIRVFRLSAVKGMEFEAAFFHNIDCARIEDPSLLRRYLYVGISRAVSHLGATFSHSDSDVLKYFVTGKDWKPRYGR